LTLSGGPPLKKREYVRDRRVTIARARGHERELALERRHVDLDADTLRLDPGSTKNGEGRVVHPTRRSPGYSGGEQPDRVDAHQKTLKQIIPCVFPHLEGQFRGARIRDFSQGVGHRVPEGGRARAVPHDLRRTTVRNMVNLSVPERVAMTITGHKTRSVFDRYRIVSPADLQEAVRRLGARCQARRPPPR
jgi:integrase